MGVNNMTGGSHFRDPIIFFVLATVLLIVRLDSFPNTPATTVSSKHLFSVLQWEAANILEKWPNQLWQNFVGRDATGTDRLAGLNEYLQLARLVEKEEGLMSGRLGESGSSQLSGLAKELSAFNTNYLREIRKDKAALRAQAEETVEAELSATLIETGLGSRVGLLFPPVDVRFGKLPTVLITSPRERIARVETVLLQPNISAAQRNEMEQKIFERFELSAVVDDLAGLATYPTLVSDLLPLRDVLQTSAHEWLHAYFFFRPLGRHYWDSDQMASLNETAADLAGREIGDIAFTRLGGDMESVGTRHLSREQRDPVFTREMRETRRNVDKFLEQGKVEAAEQYMKERWWKLRLGGYRIRKLNQAYFAFRGTYAASPASVSPINQEIQEMRSLSPNLRTFIHTIGGIGSYRDFLDVLQQLRKASSRREA